MQEWDYPGPDDDNGRGWTPLGCFIVLGLISLFWVTVIGGGIWLANTFNP